MSHPIGAGTGHSYNAMPPHMETPTGHSYNVKSTYPLGMLYGGIEEDNKIAYHSINSSNFIGGMNRVVFRPSIN